MLSALQGVGVGAALGVVVAGCGLAPRSASAPGAVARPVVGVAGATASPGEAVPTRGGSQRSDVVSRSASEPAPAPETVEVLEMTFVGDVIFGRYRADGFDAIAEEEEGQAAQEVFSAVQPLLRAHLAIGNLETPLVRELPEKSPIVSSARFGASAQMARALVGAGMHAMSVANNHAYDLRRAGIEQTPEILAELGIVALGSVPREGPTVRVQTLEREGWRVGVVAVATRLNGPRPRGLPEIPRVPTLELDERIVPLVKDARASHDVIVVVVHWGEEYRETPTSAQRSVAHDLVDAGVDVVVGHHSHVLQGVERYREGVIAYSLGNFLFDNPEEVQRQTGVLRVRMRGRGRGQGQGRGCLDAVVFAPVWIADAPSVRPVAATGELRERIEARMRRLSERWGTRWVAREEGMVIDAPGCSPRAAE